MVEELTAPRDDAPVEPPEAGAVADSVKRPKRRKGAATAKPQELKDGWGETPADLGTTWDTTPLLSIW